MKILVSTGGTGGHVFPAEALAEDLQARGVEVLFVGGGLKKNRYFKKEKFAYREISSSTPFQGNPFVSLYRIAKGFVQSLKEIRNFRPDCVVGFGSFYSFPVLLAACLLKIPIILFEPNAIPGKVNRFFSRWAKASAVQFPKAAAMLKGNSVTVRMPTAERKKGLSKEAREYFYLDPDRFTFLVFGGSQGAQAINRLFAQAAGLLSFSKDRFQVIHITGRADSAEALRRHYDECGIRSCVKAFEEKMEHAWSAADMAVCRSGAATVAEQVAFGVPGILIPFPKAADDHQMHNALFVEKEVQGAITCPEASLTPEKLKNLLEELFDSKKHRKMKEAILSFKQGKDKIDFSLLIFKIMGK